MNMLHKREL